jgi:beta-lactam-binding protein with PASTA domain
MARARDCEQSTVIGDQEKEGKSMLRKKWMAIYVLASALVLVLFGALVFSANAQETLRIAVISDNHDKIDQTSRCVQDIMHNTNFPKIDILVNGGDWGLWNGQCQYEEAVERGMKAPGEPYGWNDLHLPYFMVWGNHDATSYERHPDKPYFFPVASKEVGVMSPFFAFLYDNVLFLIVHSGLGNTRLLEQPQRDWLTQITSMNKDKTTLIFTHRALYDTTCASRSRTYQYFQDTDTWWADFFDNNPQIVFYGQGHTNSCDPDYELWHGVHVTHFAMMQHGDPDQMTIIEVSKNRLLSRFWDADNDQFVKTVMDDGSLETSFAPQGFEWFANAHIAQDGENFTWHNRMLAEKYKLQLIGEGGRGEELVWMNKGFSYYSPGSEEASTLWIGYEEDENNPQPANLSKPYYYPGESGFIRFNGVDAFAAATTWEGDFPHEGGHIPWSTTPWAIPGKQYKVRVRMKSDGAVNNAMDVSVMVLGETLTNVIMPKTVVLQGINLTNSYEWYEGTFTVPDNEDAWIIKTIWDSKQQGETCYMDEWSVTRADGAGNETADFWVEVNGERHEASGALPDGEVREFALSQNSIKNDLNINVGVGGSRVGMFSIVYEKPFLWSDDVSMGINSVSTGTADVHVELLSQYTPDAAFVPFQPGVDVAGTSDVQVKPGYYTPKLMELSQIPGDYEVSYSGITGETSPASAAGENSPDETADKAFDGDVNTKWRDSSIIANGSSWIQYQYDGSTYVTVDSYAITSANDAPERDPRDWNLLGSNDGGDTWDTVDSRTGVTFADRLETRYFSVSSSGAYNIYRLEITAVYDVFSADAVQLAEIELIEEYSLIGKVMVGYQGWFNAPGDGAGRGWVHWGQNGNFTPTDCSIDIWPDMTEYTAGEKFLAPGFNDGIDHYVFSSHNQATVRRHFQWMQDYGIDGVYLQRFASETTPGSAAFNHRNDVLDYCKDAANLYGRKYAVMYDLSGLGSGSDIQKVVNDWMFLIDNGKVPQTQSHDPAYMFHLGKPVVAVWGLGFGRSYEGEDSYNLINFLKNDPTYGGNIVMLGVNDNWRTNSDLWFQQTLQLGDIISPWLVGRFGNISGVNNWAATKGTPDKDWCDSNGKEYLPVIFPGFSWYNLRNGGSTFNHIPRQGGQFLWDQVKANISTVGASMLYVAMFDEVDEATAIFKLSNDPPVVSPAQFLTLDIDGYDVPSDEYLWLVGQASRGLRGEISVDQARPSRNPASAAGASAAGENPPDETADKAFDGDVNTKWLDFSPTGSWIQYQYDGSTYVTVNSYAITSANDFPERDPMNWNLLGSNDGGETWDTLDSRTGVTFADRLETRYFSVSSSGAYNIYRLEITAVYNLPAVANSVQLAEIELIEEIDEMVTVPNVVGMTQATAEANIVAEVLAVGNITTANSTTVAIGDVISQNPTAGTIVIHDSPVDIVVSLGALVPNVVGMTEAASVAAIEVEGLNDVVTSEYHFTVPVGEVISQNPAGGSVVEPGSSVDIVVSLGVLMLPVPNVVGSTQSAAEAAITVGSLVVGNVTTAYSDTVAIGLVISQNPVGGANVLAGSSVDIVVSLGVQVPDVVGMSQAAAQSAITGAGLAVGNVTTAYSDTVAEGDVISQDPAAGSGVASGTPVDIVVSLGALVPDVVGMAQAAAESAITTAGLTVGNVTTANSSTVDIGDIISQNPTADTGVDTGTPVDIVVSLGALVPNVVDMTEAAAVAAIEAEGLTADVTTAYSDTVAAGNVITQDPAGGVSVEPGTSVDLVISIDVPADTVTITKAEYKADKDEFKVEATSSDQPTVTLTLVGFGDMTWKNNKYELKLKPLGQTPPCTVTVTSSGGGSDSKVVSGADDCVEPGDPVPDVVGMTQAAAEAAIVAAGMTVGAVTTENSDTVAAGDVISQNPTAGTPVPPGTTVDLVVSLGIRMVTVPDVVGLAQAAAESAITAAVLTVGNVTTTYNDTVPAGDVISQSPAAGASVVHDNAVDIEVSLGVQPVTVPAVVGMAQVVAESTITAANLAVGTVTTEYSPTVPAGDVISQIPSSGASVAPDTSVDLVVSLGILIVTVPDVTGMAQATAESTITAAYLVVGAVTTSYSTVAAGDVISQNPEGGAGGIAAGSSVDIEVSLGVQPVTVPVVVGAAQATAESTITAADLTVGTVTTAYSGTVSAGDVISQNPSAGASVAPDTSVDLVVSLGIQMVTVPDVTGGSESTAQSTLTGLGLTTSSTRQYSETVALNDVISQSPVGGNDVAIGSSVSLVVSDGPVPSGDDVAITKAEYKSDKDEFKVEATSSEGDSVTLTLAGFGGMTWKNGKYEYKVKPLGTLPPCNVTVVSSGGGSDSSAVANADPCGDPTPQTTVPNVVGSTEAAANTAILGATLVANTSMAFNATVPEGIVISQNPSGGTTASEGSPVNLVVSLGPPATTTVPNVVGLTEAAAIDAISLAKLVADTSTHAYSDEVAAGIVIDQSPSVGTTVDQGTTVSCTISDGPAPSGDTVTIIKAEYKPDRSEFKVEATSSDGGNVTLTVV